MKIEIYKYEEGRWNSSFDTTLDSKNTLLLIFGKLGRDSQLQEAVREVCDAYPHSVVAGCSSAGEICDDELCEGRLVAAVIRLEVSTIVKAEREIAGPEESERVGRDLAEELSGKGLRAVLVLSEGLSINGTELTRGFNATLPPEVQVTGGLAGDDDRFEVTYVLDRKGIARSGLVSAIGFYGERFHTASGYKGGWDRFGVERKITSARANVLYSLNGEPALTRGMGAEKRCLADVGDPGKRVQP